LSQKIPSRNHVEIPHREKVCCLGVQAESSRIFGAIDGSLPKPADISREADLVNLNHHPTDSHGPEQADGIFRRLRNEVWIVTAADGLRRGGLTATWVHPMSIDRERPVILVALATNHHTTELVHGSGRLAACLLSREQVGIALRFAITSGRDIDKLGGLDVMNTPAEVPRLVDCQAWIEGRVFARLEAGGRTLFWADVTAAQGLFTAPVLFDHDLFAAATPQERQILLERLGEDVRIQRPLDGEWRQNLGPEGQVSP